MAKITGKLRREYNALLQSMAASVEALPLPVMHKVAPILAQAEAELMRDLKKWLAKQDGDAKFTTQKYRSALRQIREAMRTIKRVEPAMVDGLTVASKNAGVLSTAGLENEMLRFHELFTGEMRPIAIEASSVLAAGDKIVIKRFPRSAARYSGHIRKRLLQELAVGRIRGESIFQIGLRLDTVMPRIFAQFSRRGQMIARTEVMNAYNVYHHEGIASLAEDDSGMRERWDASYDRRRCHICADLDGKVVDVGAGFTAKWTFKGDARSLTSQHPPAHPRCRCILVAWHVDWKLEPEERAPPVVKRPPVVSKAKPKQPRKSGIR